jgi:hypothetical protein
MASPAVPAGCKRRSTRTGADKDRKITDSVSDPSVAQLAARQLPTQAMQAATRKRQRRLTAAQRAPQPDAAAKPDQTSAEKCTQRLRAEIMKNFRAQLSAEAAARALIPAAPAVAPPAAAAPVERAGSSGSDDSDSEEEAGYQSAGPSLKVAPGKRIKWRGAIHEDDVVRRDLGSMFRQISFWSAVPPSW